MHAFVYRAEIGYILNDHTADLMLDLGFHVRVEQRLVISLADNHYEQGDRCYALVRRGKGDAHLADLCRTPDGFTAHHGIDTPRLWRYPAELLRVVDGDTLDARINLGFGVYVHHRLRLAGIQAPEIRANARGTPEWQRGSAARDYLFARLNRSGGAMEIVSSRHGKWRRWIAEIYLPDSERSLNQELVDEGHAQDWHRWRSSRTTFRVMVDLDLTQRRLLGAHAQLGQTTESGLMQGLLQQFLEQQKPGAG